MKALDNPFIDNISQKQTVVDMKGKHRYRVTFRIVKGDNVEFHINFSDVMVLNDIIEQAAGREMAEAEHGGKFYLKSVTILSTSQINKHTIAICFYKHTTSNLAYKVSLLAWELI